MLLGWTTNHPIPSRIVDAIAAVGVSLGCRADDTAVRRRPAPTPSVASAVDLPSVAVVIRAASHVALPEILVFVVTRILTAGSRVS